MSPSDTQNQGFQETVNKLRPNVAFVVMIFGALIAFEIFNFSTTDHALGDLLGDLSFWGLPWSSVLAIAFCGIDFAGIARLFTPEQGADEPKEVWYLFGAWLLAATMNAILTWWGVSMAVANHQVTATAVVDPAMISGIVPVFVAIMVWVIRILIIGTLSLAMDRLLHPGVEQRTALQNAWGSRAPNRVQHQPTQPMHLPMGLNSSGTNGISNRGSMSASQRINSAGISSRPSNRGVGASSGSTARFNRASTPEESDYEFEEQPPLRNGRPDPTYHTLSMSTRPSHDGTSRENTGANRFRRS